MNNSSRFLSGVRCWVANPELSNSFISSELALEYMDFINMKKQEHYIVEEESIEAGITDSSMFEELIEE